jgi:hypothetical protein
MVLDLGVSSGHGLTHLVLFLTRRGIAKTESKLIEWIHPQKDTHCLFLRILSKFTGQQ